MLPDSVEVYRCDPHARDLRCEHLLRVFCARPLATQVLYQLGPLDDNRLILFTDCRSRQRFAKDRLKQSMDYVEMVCLPAPDVLAVGLLHHNDLLEPDLPSI